VASAALTKSADRKVCGLSIFSNAHAAGTEASDGAAHAKQCDSLFHQIGRNMADLPQSRQNLITF
jgi:hypothetical protein